MSSARSTDVFGGILGVSVAVVSWFKPFDVQIVCLLHVPNHDISEIVKPFSQIL